MARPCRHLPPTTESQVGGGEVEGVAVSPWDTGGQEALALGGGFCLDVQAEQRGLGLGSCLELGWSRLRFMVL